MKVLHIEENHPSLIEGLDLLGFQNDLALDDSLPEVLSKIGAYDGLILRSKFKIDKTFLLHARNLKFIGRLGVGLDNINLNICKKLKIHVQPATGMNADAVAEYVIGSSLYLIKNISLLDNETKKGL